ncbi:MAG: hypothetical protein K5694_07340 [Bacilli bacterium]|nr:hypothetical protein [Bacilli bacterium]
MSKKYKILILLASVLSAAVFGIFLGVGIAGFLGKMSMRNLSVLTMILLAALLLSLIFLGFMTMLGFRERRQKEMYEAYFEEPPSHLSSLYDFRRLLENKNNGVLLGISYLLDEESYLAKKIINSKIYAAFKDLHPCFRSPDVFYLYLDEGEDINKIEEIIQQSLKSEEIKIKKILISLTRINERPLSETLALSLYGLLRGSKKKDSLVVIDSEKLMEGKK